MDPNISLEPQPSPSATVGPSGSSKAHGSIRPQGVTSDTPVDAADAAAQGRIKAMLRSDAESKTASEESLLSAQTQAATQSAAAAYAGETESQREQRLYSGMSQKEILEARAAAKGAIPSYQLDFGITKSAKDTPEMAAVRAIGVAERSAAQGISAQFPKSNYDRCIGGLNRPRKDTTCACGG